MKNGDYINKLVEGVRGGIAPLKEEVKAVKNTRKKSGAKTVSSDINELLENIRNFEVKGDSKRLIRMDARTEEVLKLLSPMLRVEVTSFVNFLCWDFLENNPELVNEIKQSIQKL